MPEKPLLRVCHLCKTYSLKNKKAFKALDDISLDVYEGDFVVLLGPSGSGKSTLLHTLSGLEKPDSGEIILADVNITHHPPAHRGMSMVFQNYILYPHMNVRENLAYPLKMNKTAQDVIEREIEKTALDLGISDLLDRRPDQLSGGQKQRIAIARSIIKKPKIYLFDEPFSSLDSRLKDKMRQQMKILHQNLGATIIYVTHDQIEAMSLATSLAIMRNGKIIQTGSPKEIYAHPQNIFTADFLGFPAINLCACTYQDSALYLGEQILCAPCTLPVNIEHETNYILGMRPEHIQTQPASQNDAVLHLHILSLEYLGSMHIVHAQIGNQDLRLCLMGQESENISVNEKKDFYISREKILIYSKKDETLLGKLSDFC